MFVRLVLIETTWPQRNHCDSLFRSTFSKSFSRIRSEKISLLKTAFRANTLNYVCLVNFLLSFLLLFLILLFIYLFICPFFSLFFRLTSSRPHVGKCKLTRISRVPRRKEACVPSRGNETFSWILNFLPTFFFPVICLPGKFEPTTLGKISKNQVISRENKGVAVETWQLTLSGDN